MLEIFSIHITPFKQDRIIRVYLPKGYHEDNKSYPVLYMHDGGNVFNDDDAVGGISLGLEEYLDKNRVELIVIAIDSKTGEERVNEYCPWVNGEYSKEILGEQSNLGGQGVQYVDFIVKELKPFIDNKYRTLKDSNYMAGISLGGLISTYAACQYPKLFTRIAAVSCAYFRNQEEIEKLVEKSDLSLVERFYLDCGTKESNKDKKVSKLFLDSNQSVYEILKHKITKSRFEVIRDGQHNYEYFRKRFPEVLTYLLG
ncbi:alpha/beta hydrolase [Chengkuizengella axinellae]|uniref:Alpha/beta hydrolase-fold protein n=1 Tax=Chengkuizengella axinellae TaxID=3064388 RepID=A0ABT9J5Y8_9BACL|nr:alpha/beta hydrolase-fold protein [Chengkuizengella sp. 2205SS18-9]MDP5277042.1 alpha/beta hydrolase-fold protein [Chengkuizengella sp. 2205SS18-9]